MRISFKHAVQATVCGLAFGMPSCNRIAVPAKQNPVRIFFELESEKPNLEKRSVGSISDEINKIKKLEEIDISSYGIKEMINDLLVDIKELKSDGNEKILIKEKTIEILKNKVDNYSLETYLENEIKKQEKNLANELQELLERLRGKTERANRLKEYLEARAEFNLKFDGSVYNKYLPYRNNISMDSNRLHEYEKLVAKVMDNLKIAFAGSNWEVLGNYDFNKLKQVDPSYKYLIAASIVELLHNRPDLIFKTINYKRELKIVLVNELSGGRNPNGGYRSAWSLSSYPSTSHSIRIFCKKMPLPNLVSTTIHEFIHALDAADLVNDCNGKLEDMTDRQQTHFLKARERGFHLYRYNYRDEFYDKKLSEKPAVSMVNVISEYAFSNENEFLAASVERFYSRPSDFKKHCPDLYELYSEFFKFDPVKEIK